MLRVRIGFVTMVAQARAQLLQDLIQVMLLHQPMVGR